MERTFFLNSCSSCCRFYVARGISNKKEAFFPIGKGETQGNKPPSLPIALSTCQRCDILSAKNNQSMMQSVSGPKRMPFGKTSVQKKVSCNEVKVKKGRGDDNEEKGHSTLMSRREGKRTPNSQIYTEFAAVSSEIDENFLDPHRPRGLLLAEKRLVEVLYVGEVVLRAELLVTLAQDLTLLLLADEVRLPGAVLFCKLRDLGQLVAKRVRSSRWLPPVRNGCHGRG